MRVAADELRAELAGDTATFVVNRNINFTNVCVVGCAFCGFGQGKRSPDAYHVSEDDFQARIDEAVRVRRDRDLHAGRHPSRTTSSRTTGAGCGWRKRSRRSCTCTPTRRWRCTTCASAPGAARTTSSTTCASAASARPPGPPPRCSTTACAPRISPNKLPADRWVEIIEACHRSGLRSTSTVMFGHIEEPWELARHMRVVRELQERTGGITEFVPLSFIPFQTLLGRTHGIEEISAEREPQAHRRLPAGARALDQEPAGELGQDGHRRGDREPALGRQRPRRHADGGEHLADGRLPARGPARARGPDRRGAQGRPHARPSGRPSTRSSRRTRAP